MVLFHLVAVAVRNVIAFCFCSISTFVPVGRYNRVVAQPHLADIRKDCSGRRPPYNRYMVWAWAWAGAAADETERWA
jgi:hypothetical protein